MKDLAKSNEVEKDWYSKQELAIEFGVDPKTIQRIVNEQITLDRPVQTKKGVFMETLIIINIVCIFVSLIYALF